METMARCRQAMTDDSNPLDREFTPEERRAIDSINAFFRRHNEFDSLADNINPDWRKTKQ